MPIPPATLLAKVDYQAASLGSNQMGKESDYPFAKFFGAKKYKEWAREMIFALNKGEVVVHWKVQVV